MAGNVGANIGGAPHPHSERYRRTIHFRSSCHRVRFDLVQIFMSRASHAKDHRSPGAAERTQVAVALLRWETEQVITQVSKVFHAHYS